MQRYVHVPLWVLCVKILYRNMQGKRPSILHSVSLPWNSTMLQSTWQIPISRMMMMAKIMAMVVKRLKLRIVAGSNIPTHWMWWPLSMHSVRLIWNQVGGFGSISAASGHGHKQQGIAPILAWLMIVFTIYTSFCVFCKLSILSILSKGPLVTLISAFILNTLLYKFSFLADP